MAPAASLSIAMGAGIAQCTLGLATVAPFLVHRIITGRWSRRGLPLLPDSVDTMPFISLVLPTWNEGLIIEGKMADIAAQEYPRESLEVIVIDAASDDDTVERVRDWLSRNADDPIANRFRIIEEEERAGKSVSINLAFEAATEEAEVLMMSDVDCRLSPGALMHVGRRFLDDSIGAVTGRQVILNPDVSQKTEEEVTYRNAFTVFRIGESCADSTPIFHGECAAYRRSSLGGHRLVEGANADDSQMAVAVRRKGTRAIYDPNLVFHELAPPDGEAQSIQKVRRAQGLVRHFWRNRDLAFRPRHGAFGWTMGVGLHMHVLAPWLMVFGFLTGIVAVAEPLSMHGPSEMLFGGEVPLLLTVLACIDAFVLLLLIAGALGIPVPISGVAWTFFAYMLVLLRAQTLIMRGKSLHRWEQVRAVREALAEMERVD